MDVSLREDQWGVSRIEACEKILSASELMAGIDRILRAICLSRSTSVRESQYWNGVPTILWVGVDRYSSSLSLWMTGT